jgi:hypothetical protein
LWRYSTICKRREQVTPDRSLSQYESESSPRVVQTCQWHELVPYAKRSEEKDRRLERR